MVNECFNPQCRKPLHYLREGRVFVFGVKNNPQRGNDDGSHLEHYWLCGPCAQQFALAQNQDGIQMVKRSRPKRAVEIELQDPRIQAAS